MELREEMRISSELRENNKIESETKDDCYKFRKFMQTSEIE